MFGIFYLGMRAISHIGYGIKSFFHDSNAKIDERTNTYTGYDGCLRDADTNKKRYWSIDENGDEILKDTPTHVVRNLSAEKRRAQSDQLRIISPDVRALDTMKNRNFEYTNNEGVKMPARARIYKDLYSGREYATRKIYVNFKDAHENKEFYVPITDPYSLVCISDDQREIEKARKKWNKYNWIDNNDEKDFIEYYRNLPFDMINGKSPLIFFSK